MGHRLSKIYTKTGDTGQTGLANGNRIDKDDPLMDAMGDVDELNSCIGLLLSTGLTQANIQDTLINTQHCLFEIGGELAMPEYKMINSEHVSQLEILIDQLNATLPPLKEFILPKGDTATCYAHLARSVCRRAERRLITYHKIRALNSNTLAFINRLSDLLFVIARILFEQTGDSETLWKHNR